MKVPKVILDLTPAGIQEGNAEPKSTPETKEEWFTSDEGSSTVSQAEAMDMNFIMQRQDEAGVRSTWTGFNQMETNNDHEVTSGGYMPIVQALPMN